MQALALYWGSRSEKDAKIWKPPAMPRSPQ